MANTNGLPWSENQEHILHVCIARNKGRKEVLRFKNMCVCVCVCVHLHACMMQTCMYNVCIHAQIMSQDMYV
jgi:hypothetical protein